jgi:sugar/nucleoside kinase (ribokinase family)
MVMSPRGGARVLVVGDANPDLILRGDVVPRFGQAEQILDAAQLVLGGSAGITAHALARLERPVSLLAAVGDDVFGAGFRRDIAQAGVAVDQLIVRPDAPTGMTVVLSKGADRAILTHPGAIPTLTGAEVLAAIEGLADLAHVHVAALFLQPRLAPALPAIFAACRQRGVSTSVDPNADPADRWTVAAGLYSSIDILLPNRVEVLALGRGRTGDDPVEAARSLAATGPLVVVKDGAAGAFAVERSGALMRASGRAKEPVDTTGAGDTFGAAFIDTWLDSHDVRASLARAVAAGAHAVMAAGGTAGQPTPLELPRNGRHRDA